MKKISENKGRQGFTLVEVIVVAVIVLILSAVAIPMYNGFIRDARISTAQNLAETAAAAANTHWRRTGNNPDNTVGTAACNITNIQPTGTSNPSKATEVLNIHFDTEKHEVRCVGNEIVVGPGTKSPDFEEQKVRFKN